MTRRPAALLAAVSLSVLVADQVTKRIIGVVMAPPGTSWPVLGRILRLTYVRNTGAAFGVLPGRTGVFMTVTLLVLAGVAIYWIRIRPARPLVVVGLGLLSAGALGNLIDRAVSGRVTDFIQLPFDFPVFNVADMAIFFGVGLLVWWILFGPAEHGAAIMASDQRDAPLRETGADADAADAGTGDV